MKSKFGNDIDPPLNPGTPDYLRYGYEVVQPSLVHNRTGWIVANHFAGVDSTNAGSYDMAKGFWRIDRPLPPDASGKPVYAKTKFWPVKIITGGSPAGLTPATGDLFGGPFAAITDMKLADCGSNPLVIEKQKFSYSSPNPQNLGALVYRRANSSYSNRSVDWTDSSGTAAQNGDIMRTTGFVWEEATAGVGATGGSPAVPAVPAHWEPFTLTKPDGNPIPYDLGDTYNLQYQHQELLSNERGELLSQLGLWRNGRLIPMADLFPGPDPGAPNPLIPTGLNKSGVFSVFYHAAPENQAGLLMPVQVVQLPITATSGTGELPATNGLIRFCRWIDAYPNGIRDNQFADKDRDRFQIRIPLVIPNLTKMRIKATELHGAIINGTIENKTTDGDYEVDMKQVNGAMVSEPILLVSVGDDDVTFNGKGTDNGKNDQTLLADFGSKIIVTFPELANAEVTFHAQAPIAVVTLDMVYFDPVATGAAPVTSIPVEMMKTMKRQAQKIQEIFRQIGFKVDGTTVDKILPFPKAWVDVNGTDPANNLNSTETGNLRSRVLINLAPSKSIRVGFVDAKLTSQNNISANGIAIAGFDPALVSLRPSASEDDFTLAHEVGHVLGRLHSTTYEPNNTHWLMYRDATLYWTFDSTAPIRWEKGDAEAMKNKDAPFYVKAP